MLLTSPSRACAFASVIQLRPPILRRSIHRHTCTMKNSLLKIGTHDGTFHCDEALACHMLRQLPRFNSSPIVRTRDPAVLSTLDIVVDVGAEYNPSAMRFDHHQRGFESTFADSGPRSKTKLSSAGLVYKHFGKEVVSAVLKKNAIELAADDIHRVYLHVYDSFVEEVDAIDNGVQRYESDKPARYKASTDLSSRVARLNADWYEKSPDQDANFLKAVSLTGSELDDAVIRAARSWLPARSIIAKAMASREMGGKVMVLREWAPWKDHLYELEKEEGEQGRVLYVLYEDMTQKSWRIQCVPVESGSFTSRQPLPESWRGMRGKELDQICGVDKCVFVHAAGFIGGNEQYDGAIQMAQKALNSSST